MTKVSLGKTASIIVIALVAGLYTCPAQAQTESSELLNQVEQYGQEGQNNQNNNLGQVTNVSQLRDVSPTDWAYEALRSLVDRYGCIAGFPNQTYRGNQSLTRYEFAAGLNSCLNQIERLIASSESPVSQEDLAAISQLNQEFEAELATLGGRVDELESRTAVLEDSQFSTTTKLVGEAVFGVASVISGSNTELNQDTDDDDIDRVPVFGYRTRLELETSFTGDDLLFTRLSTGNFPEFSETTGTFQGELAFAQPDDNDLNLEVLFYDRPIGENTNVLIGAFGLAADDIANTLSVLDGDGGSGAISAFGTRSPIYSPPGETGLGIIHSFGDKLELSAGYLAGEASDPNQGAGLFNGSYSALGQLTITPFEKLGIALTYVNGYNQSDTGVGSDLANIKSLTEPGEDADPLVPGVFEGGVPTSSNSYGAQFSYALSDRIVIGGWGGLSKVRTLDAVNVDGQIVGRGSQDIWNWAATLAFPDLGKEGSMGGIIVGMEPWVSDSSIDAEGFNEDEEKSLHAEAFYQYQLNDNIAITPGVIYVNKPDNNSDNDDLFIGALRTTFSF
jgi:Carbohydrate-selective porin, OprB family/S-layer homology domain